MSMRLLINRLEEARNTGIGPDGTGFVKGAKIGPKAVLRYAKMGDAADCDSIFVIVKRELRVSA